MTPREAEVVELMERGVPMRRIAEDTGLSLSYVRLLERTFDFDSLERQERRREAKIRAATKALERAILATGRRHS